MTEQEKTSNPAPAWSGWDKSNLPWSETKHKDSVCAAVFGPTWSMEDAHAVISAIDTALFHPAPVTQMTGWQDISSAPKNTKALAAYRNENGKWRIVTACYHTELPWSDEYGDHEEEYAPEGWYEESDSSEVIYQTSSQPTHWQPLPAPPATTEGQPDAG